MNIEDELAIAIEGIGGQRVTDLTGKKPPFENADFIFPEDAVIGELKCLEDDHIIKDGIVDKASSLYLQELSAGRTNGIVFGEVAMTTAGFSDEFRDKIEGLYRVPIERLFIKIDRQICATAEALSVANPIGLALIANNNHSALDPEHGRSLIQKILARDRYPAINAAVLFSGNLGASLQNDMRRLDYWIEIRRDAQPPPSNSFLSSLRQAWLAHVSARIGMNATFEEIGPGSLAALSNNRDAKR
jgi:hypothetical protein